MRAAECCELAEPKECGLPYKLHDRSCARAVSRVVLGGVVPAWSR